MLIYDVSLESVIVATVKISLFFVAVAQVAELLESDGEDDSNSGLGSYI